jgi:hypothetical protein
MLALQEIRKPLENTPAYNYVSLVRSGGYENSSNEGKSTTRLRGGVAIGVEKSLVFRDLTALILHSFLDLQFVLVHFLNECFELFVFNVYVNHFSHKRKLFAQLGQ